jgi:hypothetical protein
MDARLLVLSIFAAGDIDRHLLTAVGRGRSDGYAANAGDGGDLLLDLIDECGAGLTRLDALPLPWIPEVHHDAGLHDVIGFVAEGLLGEMEKTADGGAGGGHEQESECDLGSDKHVPAMFCRPGGEAKHARGQRAGEIRTRESGTTICSNVDKASVTS